MAAASPPRSPLPTERARPASPEHRLQSMRSAGSILRPTESFFVGKATGHAPATRQSPRVKAALLRWWRILSPNGAERIGKAKFLDCVSSCFAILSGGGRRAKESQEARALAEKDWGRAVAGNEPTMSTEKFLYLLFDLADNFVPTNDPADFVLWLDQLRAQYVHYTRPDKEFFISTPRPYVYGTTAHVPPGDALPPGPGSYDQRHPDDLGVNPRKGWKMGWKLPLPEDRSRSPGPAHYNTGLQFHVEAGMAKGSTFGPGFDKAEAVPTGLPIGARWMLDASVRASGDPLVRAVTMLKESRSGDEMFRKEVLERVPVNVRRSVVRRKYPPGKEWRVLRRKRLVAAKKRQQDEWIAENDPVRAKREQYRRRGELLRTQVERELAAGEKILARFFNAEEVDPFEVGIGEEPSDWAKREIEREHALRRRRGQPVAGDFVFAGESGKSTVIPAEPGARSTEEDRHLEVQIQQRAAIVKKRSMSAKQEAAMSAAAVAETAALRQGATLEEARRVGNAAAQEAEKAHENAAEDTSGGGEEYCGEMFEVEEGDGGDEAALPEPVTVSSAPTVDAEHGTPTSAASETAAPSPAQDADHHRQENFVSESAEQGGLSTSFGATSSSSIPVSAVDRLVVSRFPAGSFVVRPSSAGLQPVKLGTSGHGRRRAVATQRPVSANPWRRSPSSRPPSAKASPSRSAPSSRPSSASWLSPMQRYEREGTVALRVSAMQPAAQDGAPRASAGAFDPQLTEAERDALYVQPAHWRESQVRQIAAAGRYREATRSRLEHHELHGSEPRLVGGAVPSEASGRLDESQGWGGASRGGVTDDAIGRKFQRPSTLDMAATVDKANPAASYPEVGEGRMTFSATVVGSGPVGGGGRGVMHPRHRDAGVVESVLAAKLARLEARAQAMSRRAGEHASRAGAAARRPGHR